MPKANLIPKRNSVFKTVAKPPASTTPRGIDPTTGEVIGVVMAHDSQENVNSWWGCFAEMATECPDWTQRNRQRHHRSRRCLR